MPISPQKLRYMSARRAAISRHTRIPVRLHCTSAAGALNAERRAHFLAQALVLRNGSCTVNRRARDCLGFNQIRELLCRSASGSHTARRLTAGLAECGREEMAAYDPSRYPVLRRFPVALQPSRNFTNYPCGCIDEFVSLWAKLQNARGVSAANPLSGQRPARDKSAWLRLSRNAALTKPAYLERTVIRPPLSAASLPDPRKFIF